MIKTYNNHRNIAGELIKKYRKKRNISREELSNKLELQGVYINRDELYRIETNQLLVKDFEIAAISEILDIYLILQ